MIGYASGKAVSIHSVCLDSRSPCTLSPRAIVRSFLKTEKSVEGSACSPSPQIARSLLKLGEIIESLRPYNAIVSKKDEVESRLVGLFCSNQTPARAASIQDIADMAPDKTETDVEKTAKWVHDQRAMDAENFEEIESDPADLATYNTMTDEEKIAVMYLTKGALGLEVTAQPKLVLQK